MRIGNSKSPLAPRGASNPISGRTTGTGEGRRSAPPRCHPLRSSRSRYGTGTAARAFPAANRLQPRAMLLGALVHVRHVGRVEVDDSSFAPALLAPELVAEAVDRDQERVGSGERDPGHRGPTLLLRSSRSAIVAIRSLRPIRSPRVDMSSAD